MSYTAKQTKAINEGWTYLSEFMDRTDFTLPGMLRDALRDEKRDPAHGFPASGFAKAIVMRNFLVGFRKPNYPAVKLTGMRAGVVKAILIGARISDQWKVEFKASGCIPVIEAGVAAHDTAFEARMNANK